MENKGGKQCRRRWQNYLNCDNNKQGGWSPEEDEVLMREHKIVGNKWTEIAKAVGGRTDNAVKNRYAALMTKQSGGTASGGVKKKKPSTTSTIDDDDVARRRSFRENGDQGEQNEQSSEND